MFRVMILLVACVTLRVKRLLFVNLQNYKYIIYYTQLVDVGVNKRTIMQLKLYPYKST